ncbi:MAG: 16S rRNA (uracil(1498)-N(3))-methyltransferase [Armatimonadota bacterium]
MLFIAVEELEASVIEITGDRYHHLARVRRVRIGESLQAALPDGRVLRVEVEEITQECLRARVVAEEPVCGVSPCRITLYQAVLKGEKMDLVVQKAAELGAALLVPLQSRRSIPRWSPAQAIERRERWQRIADSAAEQCERSIPMQVMSPRNLQDVLHSLPAISLLLHERQGNPLPQVVEQHPHLTQLGIFIGPEGGWDADEVEQLVQAGVLPIHLGGRILRAETASLAALTLMQYLWGDLA